jgi:hypothetical protein
MTTWAVYALVTLAVWTAAAFWFGCVACRFIHDCQCRRLHDQLRRLRRPHRQARGARQAPLDRLPAVRGQEKGR